MIEGVSWLENNANDIYFPPISLASLSRGKENIMKLKNLKELENLSEDRLFVLGIFGLLAFWSQIDW